MIETINCITRLIIFQIKTIEAGQRDRFGPKYYSYEITSYFPEKDVKKICTTRLKPSSSKDQMPNAFSGELIEFKNLTGFYGHNGLPDKYSYKVKFEYTG